MSSNVSKSAISELLKVDTTGLSATKISQHFGFKSATKAVKTVLDSMVNENTVKAVQKGSYVAYFAPEEAAGTAQAQSAGNTTQEPQVGAFEDLTSLNTPSNLYGFGLEMDQSARTAKVTLIDGSVTNIDLKNERVVVVNRRDAWVASSKLDAISAVNEFAQSNNIGTYAITDANSGAMCYPGNNGSDIDYTYPIVFLEVARHNKAG